MDTYTKRCLEILEEVRVLPIKEPVTFIRFTDTYCTKLCISNDKLYTLCDIIEFTLLKEQAHNVLAVILSKDYVVIKFIPPCYAPAVLLSNDIIDKVETLYLLT